VSATNEANSGVPKRQRRKVTRAKPTRAQAATPSGAAIVSDERRLEVRDDAADPTPKMAYSRRLVWVAALERTISPTAADTSRTKDVAFPSESPVADEGWSAWSPIHLLARGAA